MPFTPADLDDALDVAGLAELLHINRRSAERIVSTGQIDVIRVGAGRGKVRIPRRAVTDYINRRATKARAS